MKKYLFYTLSAILLIIMLIGCGGGSSDFQSNNSNNNNSTTVTVIGKVTNTSTENNRRNEERNQLNQLTGTIVYVEGRKDLFGITDSDGKFIINNVPIGKQAFIAEKKEMGRIAYRQRVSPINVTESKEAFELTTPITISHSPYKANFIIKDADSGKSIPFAKAVIWDTEYTSDSEGNLCISDFPEKSNEKVVITATGFRTYPTEISFGKNLNAVSEIKITKNNKDNLYPTINIKYQETSSIFTNNNKLYLEPNTYITLEAQGFDPDDSNNSLIWNWSASSGKFNGSTNNKTIMYIATENSKEITISLAGKDKENAIAHASIKFAINSKNPISTNHPPYNVYNISPINNAKNISGKEPIEFKWHCQGDPDENDIVQYSVFLKKENNDFLCIGETANQSLVYSQTLDCNSEYSWYVKATDKIGSSTQSDIWKFTTENLREIDFIPPTQLSDTLKLQFVKVVDTQETDITRITFLPPVVGKWTWTNNNQTAEFIPTNGSWLSGSYNALYIATGTILFDDKQKNTTSHTYKFELPSSIPIPEGYRSYAFPMEIEPNEVAGCIIPGLRSNKNAYALIINNDTKMQNGQIEGANLTNIKDPTYKFRMQEIELQNKKLPDLVLYGKTASMRASLKHHEIYEARQFIICDDTPKVIEALLADYNDKVLIYVDREIEATIEDVKKRAHILLSEFSKSNGVLTTNENYFGKAPQCGPDGEERLTIVLYAPQPNSQTLGYFTPIDLYEPNLNNSHLLRSNACKAIYLNYEQDETNLKATLAHEYQHLIYFYHKRMAEFPENNYTMTQNDIWLNESLSKFAEELNGFDINNNPNTASWILRSQAQIDKLSLTHWDGNTYGIAYLFMHFLAQPGRYKSTSQEVTQAIISSGCIEATKDIERITNEPFRTTLAKWALSLYINDWNSNNPKAYGIHGINLYGHYGDIELKGFPIYNIAIGKTIGPISMPENGFVCVKAPSQKDISLTVIAFKSEQPTTAYFFDERE